MQLFNNLQLYNKLVHSATRSKGGLNKSDMKQIENIYGPLPPLPPSQLGGAMEEFSIFTLNIRMFKNADYKRLAQRIKSVNADIVFIQEDIIKTSTGDYEWLNRGPEPRYQLLYQCESHQTNSPLGDRLANSIYKRTSMHNKFDIRQRYSYNSVDDITSDSNAAKRCAAISKFGNILMASVHLTGGRFDDEKYATLGLIKSQQLNNLVALGVDLIAGDFNGDTDIGDQLDKYNIYTNLSPKEKKVFGLYWTAGHELLVKHKYQRVELDGVTSAYGTRVDHIYYNPSKLKLLDAQLIDCSDVTDHSGILARFAITDDTDRCNSIMSYDCIIYPDNYSEVILRKGSIIYRSGKLPCSQDHMFFGGLVTASVYTRMRNGGNLNSYLVRRDLRLLDLNNYVNIQHLINASKKEKEEIRMAVQLYFVNGIREIGDYSYHTKTGHKKDVNIAMCDVVKNYTNQVCSSGFITLKDRNDSYYLSRTVLKFVCSLGFDGTIHMGMMAKAKWPTADSEIITNVGGAFHDEIGICSCSKDLEVIN